MSEDINVTTCGFSTFCGCSVRPQLSTFWGRSPLRKSSRMNSMLCTHTIYVISIFSKHVGPWFEGIWIFLWKQIPYKRHTPNSLRMGLLVTKKKLSYGGFFPIETCRMVIAQADVIVVVEVEQQHTMWQVEWQWPRESAFSHPDPPVTPSSCPPSWDAWREKSAPTSLTRSTPTHSSCSKSELAPEQSRVIVRQASSAEWMWHRVANSGGRELLNYGIFYRQ